MEIYITFEDSMQNWGSIQVRAFEIHKHLSMVLPVHILPISQMLSIKDSLVIYVKPEFYSNIEQLISNQNYIIIDILDSFEVLSKHTHILPAIDAAIFCNDLSMMQFSSLFKYPKLCTTIYHHWNPVFNNLASCKIEHPSIVYFGNSIKCNLFNEIQYINYLSLSNDQFNNMHTTLSHYNCHYIIKPDNSFYCFEPLTKVATASALGSPVISVKDANCELLGPDYPYYADSYSLIDTMKTIEKIYATFHSRTWDFAVEIMESIRMKTSISSSINDYVLLIKSFQSISTAGKK